MIRLGLTLNGQKVVALGLQPENIERMCAGQPVKVNLRNLDPDGPPTDLPDVDVIVCAVDTDDWRAFMRRLGLPERADGMPEPGGG